MTLNPNQFKGPFYHGSPRRFESGDHVKPGIEGHAFATTDKEKAETYTEIDKPEPPQPRKKTAVSERVQLYPFGINNEYLMALIHSMDLPVDIAPTLREADLILTVKTKNTPKSKLSAITKGQQIPIHILKENTVASMSDFFRRFFDLGGSEDDIEGESIREAENACLKVIEEGKSIELSPRHAYHRRIQHNIIEAHGLNSVSVGEDPNRRVRIYPKVK